MKKMSLMVLMSAVLCAAVAPAQDQPAQATNEQNEVVNLDRFVDSTTDSFKILRSGDKKEINRYVARVFELEHANPYEILPYLRSIATLEKGTVNTAWNPKSDGTARSWIQVNVPDFQLDSISALVASYDVPDFESITGDVKFSYRTKYRSAVEVAEFIRTSTLSPDGLIRADAATNTLYVHDSPSDFLRVFGQIQFYDIPTAQLDVEISIIELTNTDQTSLGLDWDAWKTALSGEATASASANRLDPPGAPAETFRQQGFEGFLSIDATAAARFLNYLVDDGKATVHARTNLTVANNSIATLTSGTAVPAYQYRYDPGIGKSVLVRAPRADGEPAGEGLTLSLVPNIAMESAQLDVALLMRSPVSISKTGQPIYSEQEVQANLTLAQEQLFKLGGIRRRTEATQRRGFPLLRDIPVVKYLFSNETRVLRETELYVFIRPTWSAPLLPALDGMKGHRPVRSELLDDLLAQNPNLSISTSDREVLQRYFERTP